MSLVEIGFEGRGGHSLFLAFQDQFFRNLRSTESTGW